MKTDWNGQGRPPVGTPIEMKRSEHSGWVEITPLYCGDQKLFFESYAGNQTIEESRLYQQIELRPIRTTEQIAIDERKLAISAMIDALRLDPTAEKTSHYTRCGLIYDAGFRKQVAS